MSITNNNNADFFPRDAADMQDLEQRVSQMRTDAAVSDLHSHDLEIVSTTTTTTGAARVLDTVVEEEEEAAASTATTTTTTTTDLVVVEAAPPSVDQFKKYLYLPKDKVAVEMCEEMNAVFWRVMEFASKMDQDVIDWNEKLTADERHFLSMALGFFAASDGLVAENLMVRFYEDASDEPSHQQFYSAQMYFEHVHAEAYSLLITRLVQDDAEKDRLFNAVENHECVRRKALWAHKWLCAPDNGDVRGRARRLAAFACVEGIFFSTSFCTIHWFRDRALLPGTTLSNEWISRDEGMHTDFAIHRYRRFPAAERLSDADLYALVDEAMQIEKQFVLDSLPFAMPEMNATLMVEYLLFVTDRILLQFGLRPVHGIKKVPFKFMDKQSMTIKTNFFEGVNANYALANNDATPDMYDNLDLGEEF